MDQHDELSRLETMVKRLLQRFNEVQEENKQLTARLLRQEEAVTALNAEVEGLKTEKQQVLQRVSGLLTLLDRWEGEVLAAAPDNQPPATALDLPGVTG